LTELKVITETRVRFSEIDSLHIAWHGSYVKYLEDGREEFGNKFNLGYLTIYDNGFYAPLVKMDIDFKKPLIYGDTMIIETAFQNTEAAKIKFDYKIYNKKDKSLVLCAKTIQVFLNRKYELVLYPPDFFIDWKKQWNLIA
jgi:acyl-CoA thioester hydrolase